MKHSPFGGAYRSSASQENPPILWDRKALAICLYPEPDQFKFGPCLPTSILENPFSIILLSTPRSSKWPTSTSISTRSRNIAAKICQVCLHFIIPLSYAVQWPRYGLVSRENVLRFPVGIRDFSLFKRIQIGSGTHPDPHSINVRRTFPRDKADGAWSWLLTYLLPQLSMSGATHLLP